jgi:hypothetical protein
MFWLFDRLVVRCRNFFNGAQLSKMVARVAKSSSFGNSRSRTVNTAPLSAEAGDRVHLLLIFMLLFIGLGLADSVGCFLLGDLRGYVISKTDI